MKISSVHIESFKRFRKPVTLKDLSAGLNLFTAPNEGGKSTIAQAIQAAFLERHRTSTLTEFVPWGDSGASPSVRIEFTLGEQRCSVRKAFLGRKSCDVAIGEMTLTGEEAEKRLSEMLGFGYPSRGRSSEENQGIPGLLWIRQGRSYNIADEVRHASDYLRRALSDSVGELAATQGDRIIGRIAEERGKLLTKEGRPREGYLAATNREAEVSAQLNEIRRQIATYNSLVDEFTALRAAHQADEEEKPWVKVQGDLQQVRQQLAHIQLITSERASEQTRQKTAITQLGLVRAQLQKLQEDVDQLEQRRADLAAAEEEDQETLADVRRCEERHGAASLADTAAREAAEKARGAQARSRHLTAIADLSERRGQLEESRKQAQASREQLTQATQDAARLKVSEEDLAQLRQAQGTLGQTQAKLEAIATRIHFELVPGAAVLLDGRELRGESAHTIVEPATISIAGVGSIRVTPGATELAQLTAQRDRQRGDFGGLLQQLGVDSVQAAQERARQCAQKESAVTQLTAVIAALAPQGYGALDEQIAKLQGDEDRERQALGLLAPVDAEVLDVEATQAAEQRAKVELRAAGEALQSAKQAAATAKATLTTARREVDALEQRLATPGRAAEIRALNGQLLELQAVQLVADGRIQDIDDLLDQANPGLLQQDEIRLVASVQALEQGHRQQHERLVAMAATLEASGAMGLDEAVALKDRELAQLQRRVADLRLRAAALDHLLRLLQAKRADLARKLRAPLQVHLNHYLQILFPGASVTIDEDLMPSKITRAGPNGTESGAFEELSVGTREQMGVIARLAYADLLKDSGKPTHLILDDALVNSDDDRLGAMKRILFDAATRHQIFIFTCHPRGWTDLGVAPRQLQ